MRRTAKNGCRGHIRKVLKVLLCGRLSSFYFVHHSKSGKIDFNYYDNEENASHDKNAEY